MSSGDDGTGTDRPASPPLAGPVPVGWERKVEEGSVCYISPSGTALTSLEQICAYLLAEGTCKCGLECPLNMHKVFNFDPGAAVAGRGAPGAQGQQDMTKLCNHRRKTAAMATLYHSMEGTLGPCHPGTGPGLSLLFSAEGHLAMAPHTGTHLPSTVGSFPTVPSGTKILEAPSAPTGTWLTTAPFLQPHDIVPGANGIPESHSPVSPCFGLPLPLPDVANPPQSPVAQSQRPMGRTSTWPALSQGATGESRGLGAPGLSLPATTGAPQADKVNSVSDALTSQSSNNPPVPLDAVPEGRGFLGLPPVSTPFPASSLLSLAAKAQLGNPDPVPALSTLPPCPLSPGMLLSLMGERAPGRGSRWLPDPQDPVAHRVPPDRKGVPPSVTGQPLAALLSLLGAWGCPREGGPGVSSLPLGPLPATSGSPCPGTGLLPTSRDFSGQLQGLFGQLAPSSEPTSGTSPRSKASGPNSGPGNLPVLSPLLQNQSLLFPLGLSLGSDQDTASPLAGLFQSLQLCPRFGSPEKSATLLGPSAGCSPNPSAPPGPLEVIPSALEPPVPCLAEPGSPRPNEGARVCPTSHSPLKRGRRRAEGLNRETPSLCGPPSTKSPRRGAGRRGWGTQRHFNGQADDRGGKGLPATAPPAPHPTWRCNGDIPAAEQQLRVEEIKGSSLHLRPSCRGWRRKVSTPQPSTFLETPQRRGLSTNAGASTAVDLAVARCPWAGRPVKNRRRKLLT